MTGNQIRQIEDEINSYGALIRSYKNDYKYWKYADNITNAEYCANFIEKCECHIRGIKFTLGVLGYEVTDNGDCRATICERNK